MSNPPQNTDAERAVLGAILQAPHMIDELANTLTGADFYHPRHEAIWNAALAVHSRGDRPDVLLVSKTLGSELSKIGGVMYLQDLTTIETIPVFSQAPHYAALIRETATARRLIEAGIKIRQCAEEADDINEAADTARKILDEAISQTRRTETGISAADLVHDTLDELDSEHDPGIATGWDDIDDVVNGMRAGQLIIIGARPSVGKSVIAANVAAAACKAGVGVHFASLEMTRTEVMQRMFAAHATVNLTRLVNHQLTEDDWQRLAEKSAAVTAWPLWVDDEQSQSLAQLRARARGTARRLPLGMVVVDYLQLMAPRSRAIPREQQVGELSEGLKGLAKELRVPVIALAQVNRGPSDRQDKRPQMSDLRESGRIEADADQVWLLHRQDLVDPKSATGELEVIVAKNRNGQSGRTVTLGFQGHYSRAVQQAWNPSGAAA